MTAKTLPADSCLLDITNGALLVSCGNAVFCKIPAHKVPAVRDSLTNGLTVRGLDPLLVTSLEKHGFFDAPRPREKQFPVVQMQLTNECNLKCEYCCTNSAKKRTSELTYGEWKEVLEEVRNHLGSGAPVAFLGGEPLLTPFASDLLAHAVALGLNVTVFSNAIPLQGDPRMCERIAGLTRDGLVLRVSFAGTDATFCDEISNSNRFLDAFAALESLYARGGQAKVDLMLMPQNAEATASDLHEFKKRLPDGCTVTLGVLYASGRETGEHLFSRRAALEEALTRIAFESGVAIRGTKASPTTFWRDGCDCAVGLNLHVRSDGALFSCFKMEEQVAHISQRGIGEALESIKRNPAPASGLKTCRDCPLNTICGGGCRSENFLYTGTGEPLCGPWRVRVTSELLAEDMTDAINWSVPQLFNEAKFRGLDGGAELPNLRLSRHCVDV